MYIIVEVNKKSGEYIGLHSSYDGYEADYWVGVKAKELNENSEDDTEYIVDSVEKY